MASTAQSYRKSPSPESGNLLPLRPPVPAENPHQKSPDAPLDSGLSRSRVKWSTSTKNFCYVQLEDGREAFLHRDDFAGNWPPQLKHTVLFSILIHNKHSRCAWRIKDALLPGER
jgi:cold shock CspA family protein